MKNCRVCNPACGEERKEEGALFQTNLNTQLLQMHSSCVSPHFSASDAV